MVLRDSILLQTSPNLYQETPWMKRFRPLGRFSLLALGVSHPSPYPSTPIQELLLAMHVTHFDKSSDKFTCLHFSSFQRVLPPMPSGMGGAHGSPAGPPPHVALWRTQLYLARLYPLKGHRRAGNRQCHGRQQNPM